MDDARYRVEELARETDISVRNIREYQDRGLLPPPERDGRVAIYTDEHAVRLRLIDRLLRRGYTLAVIKDLLEAFAQGRDLHDVLGLEEVVSRPWTEETPTRMTLLELRRLFGWQLTPAIIRRCVRLNILEPHGLRAFIVPSPGLIRAGSDLVKAGIPLRTVIDVIEHVQEEFDLPAERLVQMVFSHVIPADIEGGLPVGEELRQLSDIIATLRPHAQAAAHALFAQSLTRAVNTAFEQVTTRAVGQEQKDAQLEGDTIA
ncbi:MerR family transcriptional regulator [Spongisporangium articulatum]|uniref:MerR family transcriptional regulator n=1 Tax=Spongisporangium articulatum TaxID=3362603 RepID=A0ABW8ARY2_9ACTN